VDSKLQRGLLASRIDAFFLLELLDPIIRLFIPSPYRNPKLKVDPRKSEPPGFFLAQLVHASGIQGPICWAFGILEPCPILGSEILIWAYEYPGILFEAGIKTEM
jgi:hypothetical protein